MTSLRRFRTLVSAYGTHSMRRTKAAQIYKKKRAICEQCSCFSGTRNWKALCYLGIKVDDALSISEQVEL